MTQHFISAPLKKQGNNLFINYSTFKKQVKIQHQSRVKSLQSMRKNYFQQLKKISIIS